MLTPATDVPRLMNKEELIVGRKQQAQRSRDREMRVGLGKQGPM